MDDPYHVCIYIYIYICVCVCGMIDMMMIHDHISIIISLCSIVNRHMDTVDIGIAMG